MKSSKSKKPLMMCTKYTSCEAKECDHIKEHVHEERCDTLCYHNFPIAANCINLRKVKLEEINRKAKWSQ